MTWRRFYLLLAGLMVVIAVLRLAMGNVIGALVPIILAVVFASTATDYPLAQRLRQAWWLLVGRRSDRSDD